MTIITKFPCNSIIYSERSGYNNEFIHKDYESNQEPINLQRETLGVIK